MVWINWRERAATVVISLAVVAGVSAQSVRAGSSLGKPCGRAVRGELAGRVPVLLTSILKPLGVMVDQPEIKGGQDVGLTLTLTDIAGTDTTVPLSADQPALFSGLPGGILVPAGSSSASITLHSVAVTAQATATLTVNLNGGNAATSIVVDP